MEQKIIQRIKESMCVKNSMLENDKLLETVELLSDEMARCIKKGGKLLICGNGGSASDALHFAGEIVGRFQKERGAWPAMALNADVATMTAIANDYGYNEVFARQVQAFARKGDIFVGITTSGSSENVVRAMETAKRIGVKTAGLSGKDGGILGRTADFSIIVPSDVTARIQESHIMIIHILCELIEEKLTAERKGETR